MHVCQDSWKIRSARFNLSFCLFRTSGGVAFYYILRTNFTLRQFHIQNKQRNKQSKWEDITTRNTDTESLLLEMEEFIKEWLKEDWLNKECQLQWQLE